MLCKACVILPSVLVAFLRNLMGPIPTIEAFAFKFVASDLSNSLYDGFLQILRNETSEICITFLDFVICHFAAFWLSQTTLKASFSLTKNFCIDSPPKHANQCCQAPLPYRPGFCAHFIVYSSHTSTVGSLSFMPFINIMKTVYAWNSTSSKRSSNAFFGLFPV